MRRRRPGSRVYASVAATFHIAGCGDSAVFRDWPSAVWNGGAASYTSGEQRHSSRGSGTHTQTDSIVVKERGAAAVHGVRE
ncbi:hypothetical protein MRX96_030801 [Rhipicephalus microplus]